MSPAANVLTRRQFLAGTAGTGALLYLPARPAKQGVPPGLTVHPDGQITGTPTRAGTWRFTVNITDAIGQVTATPVTLTVAR